MHGEAGTVADPGACFPSSSDAAFGRLACSMTVQKTITRGTGKHKEKWPAASRRFPKCPQSKTQPRSFPWHTQKRAFQLEVQSEPGKKSFAQRNPCALHFLCRIHPAKRRQLQAAARSGMRTRLLLLLCPGKSPPLGAACLVNWGYLYSEEPVLAQIDGTALSHPSDTAQV